MKSQVFNRPPGSLNLFEIGNWKGAVSPAVHTRRALARNTIVGTDNNVGVFNNNITRRSMHRTP